jgi:hypothetical protein
MMRDQGSISIFCKYTVIKNADIIEARAFGVIDGFDIQMFENFLNAIQTYRTMVGKTPINSYVVVNEDQPYAEDVWDLIATYEDQKVGKS